MSSDPKKRAGWVICRRSDGKIAPFDCEDEYHFRSEKEADLYACKAYPTTEVQVKPAKFFT